MAYFPNGTSHDIWSADNCERCLHDADNDCPIVLLHIVHNYDQIGESERAKALRSCLSTLIPEKDSHPQKCRMFVPLTVAADAPRRSSDAE